MAYRYRIAGAGKAFASDAIVVISIEIVWIGWVSSKVSLGGGLVWKVAAVLIVYGLRGRPGPYDQNRKRRQCRGSHDGSQSAHFFYLSYGPSS